MRLSLLRRKYPCRLSDEGEELEFYVQDTGIGIDKEQQLHIFERFVKLNSLCPARDWDLLSAKVS